MIAERNDSRNPKYVSFIPEAVVLDALSKYTGSSANPCGAASFIASRLVKGIYIPSFLTSQREACGMVDNPPKEMKTTYKKGSKAVLRSDTSYKVSYA